MSTLRGILEELSADTRLEDEVGEIYSGPHALAAALALDASGQGKELLQRKAEIVEMSFSQLVRSRGPAALDVMESKRIPDDARTLWRVLRVARRDGTFPSLLDTGDSPLSGAPGGPEYRILNPDEDAKPTVLGT